jgi:hypothetical protein
VQPWPAFEIPLRFFGESKGFKINCVNRPKLNGAIPLVLLHSSFFILLSWTLPAHFPFEMPVSWTLSAHFSFEMGWT